MLKRRKERSTKGCRRQINCAAQTLKLDRVQLRRNRLKVAN
jgi:hypothetical protein